MMLFGFVKQSGYERLRREIRGRGADATEPRLLFDFPRSCSGINVRANHNRAASIEHGYHDAVTMT